ncbi:MAG: benzoate-CoA ligase family protein [Paracoccaceae bacterium]
MTSTIRGMAGMSGNDNTAVWFIDRHVTEGRSDHVAFREAAGLKREITYGDLKTRTDQVAGAFDRAGFLRDERVVCLMLDQIEYVEVFFGAMKAGVIPIALNTLLASPVYEAILKDARPSGLVVSAELWAVVAPAVSACEQLRQIIVVGDAVEGTQSYGAFMDGAQARPAVPVSADETAFWLYSSGSTGRPKGVRHVHGSMRATAETYGSQVLGVRPDDVVFSAAKIFFAYGLGNSLSFPMSVGATAILFNGRPTPDVMIDTIKTERPTIFCGVPTLYAAMVAELERNGVPDANLRLCISAGEALPEQVGLKWRDLWDVDILDGVGSTEMLHIFLSNAPGDVKYGTSGVAVPGYDLRIVDETGADQGPGGFGELLVRGSSAADGYWNQRDKSRTTFEGEWTRTGDKYEVAADGRLIYCGRTDDMFKVSGIWCAPFEVEQALVAHPVVLEAAVVPMRDGDGLEKPKAFVVLKEARPENLDEMLKEFVKDRVGKWKYPRWIDVVDDLPKTATGKIQRFKLREDDT